MCGIVGVFYKGDDGPGPVGQVLTAMCDRLFRRGADSAGVALYGSPIDRGLVVRVDLERRDAEQAGADVLNCNAPIFEDDYAAPT